ncbi:hypothetical protein NZD89_03480 [Alicyclobacillus fastidiosus]|uniref:Uncharacterized protein n=1 Tax=Alicyclobacillus fastidiosus TaxID=392011 RepID=A0ABY6ZI24_9BACL|nr:hypothetical protein [Alicyclobacillus fastidiosus]WAH42563.1 hypothetical protein NZD89_03480 [Alicyclobacillus fastidiosus]GMA64416.1 hypothetical protein GCM10025859_48560 [Alicyclobacillus fastidiosus]
MSRKDVEEICSKVALLSDGAIRAFAGVPTPSNTFLGYTTAYICVLVGMGLWRFSRQDV